MGKVKDNLSKTERYFKRNGIKKTLFAAVEHSAMKTYKDYTYIEPSQEVLTEQKKTYFGNPPKISILVPAFETKKEYLIAMLNSVCDQTYGNWELVIADASVSDEVEKTVHAYMTTESRIRYTRMKENLGISGNTNEALKMASGDYIGLLDHDDCITKDALWYFAKEIIESKPILLYSDEDKMDAFGVRFFEPHYKRKLNLDLILTNNYVCHFCVIRADVMRKLQFREEYDGAQDYDIILRTIAMMSGLSEAVHIPIILYHWRCHSNSTAANTDSKDFAYENGRRAVVDFCMQRGWNVTVSHMDHLGFYRVDYIPDLFSSRKNVGVIGGPIYKGGKICGGAMQRDGKVYYAGLPKVYTGYMHQAVLRQEVGAVDLRNIVVRDELLPLCQDFMTKMSETKDSKEIVQISLAFCEQVRMNGYRIVYDPLQNAGVVNFK